MFPLSLEQVRTGKSLINGLPKLGIIRNTLPPWNGGIFRSTPDVRVDVPPTRGSDFWGGGRKIFEGKTPEIGIPPSNRATRRYTKVHLGFCLRFSTQIGQTDRVPLFGAGPRRYIRSRLFRLAVTAFWRALTASWRQKGKRNRSFLGPFARQNCLRILRP